MEGICECVRKVVQQRENVVVRRSLRIRDWHVYDTAIDHAILRDIHQAFNLGPVLRGWFHSLWHPHSRHGQNKLLGNMHAEGDMRGGHR